jgi:hypothetical protein
MVSGKTSIEELSGTLAIGSLSFLGIFLIIDRFTDLWSLFDHYTASPTWAITFAVPTIVLTFALGLLIVSISELLFSIILKRRPSDETDDFLTVAALNNDAITERYGNLLRLKVFYQGCSLSLLVLALGVLCATRWIPGYEIFAVIMAFGCSGFAATCPYLAKRINEQIIRIVGFAKKELENSQAHKG